jgi:ribonuclease HII
MNKYSKKASTLFKFKSLLDNMRIAGVDEAGRGCVIGPLVIAAVLFEQETLPILKELGVKDSKRLSTIKREKLVQKIKKYALDYELYEIQPEIIDKVVFRSKPLRRLNYLETLIMAKLIRELKPDLVHMDSPDVNINRCRNQIQSVINYKIQIICEPKADSKYIATAAASILAKVTRDKRINELRKIHGDFNSGYPSDPKTRKFIEEYFRKNKQCPNYMRASWVTIQRYMKPFKQTKLRQ